MALTRKEIDRDFEKLELHENILNESQTWFNQEIEKYTTQLQKLDEKEETTYVERKRKNILKKIKELEQRFQFERKEYEKFKVRVNQFYVKVDLYEASRKRS